MNTLYEMYLKSGFKALKCAGYHPSQNKESDLEKKYKRAKEPITRGFTDLNYKGLTLKECEEWESKGGWIGWLIPRGMIVLDIDKEGWQERFASVMETCRKYALNPPIHKTNNGVHVFFKTATAIPGADNAYTKAGIKVTYRAGGKNQLILAPVNGRTWGVTLNGNLPDIPVELTPYDLKNREDALNVLAVKLGEAIREGTLSGYEDIDLAFMSFLIGAGIAEGRALQVFEKVYQADYNERLTYQMYQRAESRIKNGEQVRGAGSFIYALKEKGLTEHERLAQCITGKGERAVYQEEWPNPIPFDDYSLLPDFPIDVLPEAGREMANVVSEVNQVDPGMTASIYLSVLSACLAGKGIVDMHTHKEPLNIYTCSILPSGNRKSSTMDTMTKPVYEYQAKQQEAMQDTIREALNAHRIREARLAKLQKQAANADDLTERKKYEMDAAEVARGISENPVPKAPLFIVDDVTAEALGIHSAENNERMAVMSTEGGIFELMAGRYSDKGGNFDLYLKAHSGDPWSSHRVGREAKTMQSPALTMCLTVQPDVIREIGVNRQFRGRGLLARFLYSLCKSQVGYRGRQIKAVSESITRVYQKHIECLMNIPMSASILNLTREAQALWDEFYNDVETDLREGGSLHYLTDWGSKLPGAVARIAGLLHFAEHGLKAGELPISVNIVSASCVIGAYYKEHALATFGVMTEDPRIKAAKLILDFIQKYQGDTFKVRHILEAKRTLKTADDVLPGIKVLLERGYISIYEKKYTGVGRPEAIEYFINPKIKPIEKHSAEYSKSHKENSFAEFAEKTLRI